MFILFFEYFVSINAFLRFFAVYLSPVKIYCFEIKSFYII